MEARMKGCLAALLGVALALGLVAGTCRMAQASGGGTTTEPVPYLAWSGTELVEKTGDDACKAYELVTKKTTTLEGGKWYVVSESVNNKYQITVTGDVNLILCDGAELTVSEGIRGGSNTISVYAQSEDDPGTLSVKGVHGSDSVTYGVPGGDGALAMEGNLVVYGGKIYVHGGDGGWGSSGIDEYSPDGSNGGNGGGGLKGDLTLYSGRASVSGGY